MNKKVIIVGIGIILLGTLAFVMFFGNGVTPNPVPGGENPGTTFPVGTGTTPVGGGDEKKIPLGTQSGGVIYVKDFVHAPDTVPDTSNEGYYFLGNQFPTVDTAGTPSPMYVISYIAETQYFNVTLLREPIARARIEAEAYLRSHLGISNEDMCALNYMVSTPHYVNEYFTGSSLGFSFCSGSIPLE
jgi:hypothetical protein